MRHEEFLLEISPFENSVGLLNEVHKYVLQEIG